MCKIVSLVESLMQWKEMNFALVRVENIVEWEKMLVSTIFSIS